MESLFLELANNLKKQNENLKLLLKIAREHNRALRQLDAKVLNAIVSREEEITCAILRQEEARKKMAAALSERLNIDNNTELSDIIAKAPPEIKRQLEITLSGMQEVSGKLAEVNELNRSLTRQAMRFNELVLKSIFLKENQVYSQSGRSGEENLSLSFLDKKV